MVPTNLRAFLDILRRENELIEISSPVDPNLELAEIHRSVIDEQGPALELPQRLLANAASRLAEWPLVLLVDDASGIANDQTKFLWTVFTRFNPASDMYAQSSVNRHHIVYEVPIVIDARMKPGYPDELFPREDIGELVDRRWKEYFA
ncbi:UbiD family decarboxylase domain-containing protein [Paenibacillus sp. Root444D2]|uniref:UbiD family decarboxylase domain-containing protein n=1 Tax=Paenibacillus sp. Root444D2 TaxID=1736538 RepID=UPI00070A0D20|nr:hypothetical protein ASD40_20275 [Paenibacillus sp. Root444D2]